MDKHIHLVVPYHSIAMRRMTFPLQDLIQKICKVTSGEKPDPSADLNYFVPWRGLIEQGDVPGKIGILYTHCNPPDKEDLAKACNRADFIVCMAFAGRQELVELGVDPAKINVIYAGAEIFAFRRRNIAVVGYAQPNGRKRQQMLVDLTWSMDLSPYHFIICGEGWESVIEQLRAAGVSVEGYRHVNDDQLQTVYNQVDMLLVTGYAEGGPLPLLEAMACGTDVIAPPVGYAKDLLPPENLYNNVEELAGILNARIRPYLNRSSLSKLFCWQDYAQDHAALFGRYIGLENVGLIPQSGAARYVQLLDIIDQVKPQSICEIGTWSGARATQMIQEAARFYPIESIHYTGFDLFDEQTHTDFLRENSKKAYSVDVVLQRISATRAQVVLVKGDTHKTKEHIPAADFYFIDGGHLEETIANDWQAVSAVMPDSAVVVFDDYYPRQHAAGIGCNKLIESLDPAQYKVEFLPVITAGDPMAVQMVKVTKNA